MIRHADAALYAGKRHGRTTVERFDPSRHGVAEDAPLADRADGRVERVAEGDLLRAGLPADLLAEDRARSSATRASSGSPRGRLPGPVAACSSPRRRRGRTIELDVVCARAVLAGAGHRRRIAYIAINLSPRTLESDAFSPLEIVALARRHGIDPGAARRRAHRARGDRGPDAACRPPSRPCAGTTSASRSTTSGPATPACACCARSTSTS